LRIFNGKALLLKLRNPFKVIEAIPKSRKLSAHDIVVNWGLEEAQTLKDLNINVPSPIHRQYGWPGNHKTICSSKDYSIILYHQQEIFLF
jgi:hypothetical protein